MKWLDVLRYSDLAGKIVAAYKAFKGVPVGGERTVPKVVADLPGGERWESDAHQARRVR